MARIRQRDLGLERRWRGFMAEHARSGLSIRVFCARRGISEPSFHYWRRELDQRDRDAAKTSPTFVPVTVVPSAAIEVSFPNGVVVRVPAGADDNQAARLIAALAPSSRAPSC